MFRGCALCWSHAFILPSQTIVDFQTCSNSTFPASWSSLAVQQIFDANSTNPTQQLPTSQPVPDSPANPSASNLNGGQIAGIAVGAISVILLVLGSWYLISRRRRRHPKAESVENTIEVKSFSPDITAAQGGYATKDHKNELPELAWIPSGYGASEVRGDLGGAEMHGDSGAFELCGSDASMRT